MQHLSGDNEEILQLFIMAAACIGAILTSIYSLTHGIFEVFSFLYILPIILCVYFYPKRAVSFSLALSLLYIGQIYLLGSNHPNLIAVATAWFAIYMTIGVVAASYANQMLEERVRVRKILENSQDGIICYDRDSGRILELNAKCASWLRYDSAELVGLDLSRIWGDDKEREHFMATVRKEGRKTTETEGLFRAKDGTVLRLVLSVVMISKNRVFCSAIDITGSKIVDEEIRKTLEDLEGQVKARTAHLERINEELRREILERRGFEQTILSAQNTDKDDEPEEKR
jgi:PAS domain S-box-containing protein